MTTCGTGTGNFPQPGDPDLNNSVLSASPAFGGIDVSWTYPALNSFAVAHTILYRSTSNDPATRVQHRIVQGDYFFDPTVGTVSTRYYYWIEIVSVNGTVGDLIGPATAVARPTIEQTLEMLTSTIDEGLLASSLKTEIYRINSVNDALSQETKDRWAQYVDMQENLAAYQNDVDGVATLVADEIARLDTEDTAIINRLNLLAVKSDANGAAIAEEKALRADETSALASSVQTLEASVGDNIAQLQTQFQTKIDTVNNKVTQIGALYTAKVNVNGLIGGFGIYNDGSVVEAGFDVDRFWVGRTNDDKIKPFIVEDDEVFINEAVIHSLTFDKLRSADGSLVFTPAVYSATGALQKDGKLKANFIDADRLELDYGNIKNVQVGSADIQDLAVRRAHLAHASVDTLQIAGNAVFAALYTESQGIGNDSDALTLYGLANQSNVLFTVGILVPQDNGNTPKFTFVIDTYVNGSLRTRRSQFLYAYYWQTVSVPVVHCPLSGSNNHKVECRVSLYQGDGTTTPVNSSYISITGQAAQR